MSDVVILGGGPAGSALGAYLSKAGISNTILDAAVHPREHVGESMVTSSTRVFEELGFLATMEREGFVRKYGAMWHAPGEGGSFSISFAEFPQAGIRQDYTYHVDRGRLDYLLLRHAESLGSTVREGVPAKRVLFQDGRAAGVVAGIGGREVELPARFVVDASGRSCVLGNQLKLRKKDPLFDQYAVHSWFEDVDRGPRETADFIHIYFLEVERGWAWQIPITDAITSMGIVADKQVLKGQTGDLEAYFGGIVAASAKLSRAMAGARRTRTWRTEADYSYSMERLAGPGFLLVGDAARFVDPIFSSGVSVALYGAKFAAQAIQAALAGPEAEAQAFDAYEQRLRTGVGIWYEFIRLYYKLLPLFTRFIQSPKHRLQILRLLQGEVFDRAEAPVLDEMRRFIEAVEATPRHAFRGQLADLPLDDPA